jgi:protein-disulfide isomerase
MNMMKPLVLLTATAAIGLFVGSIVREKPQVIPAITAPLEVVTYPKFPSVGKADAPVEIVLIEDFQCKKCREFSQKIIPKIQSEYVKTGKARFVLVPVSFLAGSQMFANAAIEVYKQAPSRFFAYLKDVLAHEGELKRDDLLRLARRIDGLDLDRLYTCIEKGGHNQELNSNLDWARALMGAQFRTPSLYINGAVASTYSFEAIKSQVDQILEKE